MSGVVCRVPPRGGFRYSARGTEGLSVVDRQRVPFLLAQERNQRRARGALPLRPPRRLRLACGQSRRRPVTDERTSLQQPASRRAAGAMPLPVSLRNRIGSASGEARPLLRGAQRPRGGGKLRGFAAHARRARERPERALFSAAGPRRAIRLRSLGAQGARQLRPLPATDPAIGQADARAPHGRRVSDPPPCASTRQVRRTVVSIVGCTRNLN